MMSLSLLWILHSLSANFAFAEELDFYKAAQVALENNPDLKSLRYQNEALKFRSDQSLAPNNPTISYTKNNVSNLALGSAGASESYTLGYTLGFPGKAIQQSRITDKKALALHEDILSKEIDILLALSNNFVGLSANRKLIFLLEEEQKKSSDVLKITEKKYSLGQLSQVDVLNSKVFIANLEHEILIARSEKETLMNQFLSYIKEKDVTRFRPKIPDEIEVPEMMLTPEALAEVMTRNRHSLKSAQYTTLASDLSVSNALMAALPDFQFSVGINSYNLPSATPVANQFRDYNFGVTISIPLFFQLSELTGYRAAKRDYLSAQSNEDSLRLNALLDLRTNYSKYKSARSLYDNSLGLVLPAVKASYDLTLRSYMLGKADYLRLTDARQSWMQAQKDSLGHLVEMASSYNQITQLVGCDLSARKTPHGCF